MQTSWAAVCLTLFLHTASYVSRLPYGHGDPLGCLLWARRINAAQTMNRDRWHCDERTEQRTCNTQLASACAHKRVRRQYISAAHASLRGMMLMATDSLLRQDTEIGMHVLLCEWCEVGWCSVCSCCVQGRSVQCSIVCTAPHPTSR